ncbi:hypothetical protein E6H33_07580 [Candidatus Bathyarchaeota archaeon]|nr:MAG: hypothetical protein E6H33_07580 [Candidatus Bathyarchaeota archaeon]
MTDYNHLDLIVETHGRHKLAELLNGVTTTFDTHLDTKSWVITITYPDGSIIGRVKVDKPADW